MRRHKVPSTIDHCGCFAHINLFRQTFNCSFSGQSLSGIHTQGIAFGVSYVSNRPCGTCCGHMIKHFFSPHFRQLFRVARSAHQCRCIVARNHIARQHRCPDHQWSSPRTFSHFINTDHNRRALTQQHSLQLGRWCFFHCNEICTTPSTKLPARHQAPLCNNAAAVGASTAASKPPEVCGSKHNAAAASLFAASTKLPST